MASGTHPTTHQLDHDVQHGHTNLSHPEHPERFKGHPTLAERVRADVGESLQATLLELLDLSLVSKQLHWTIVGPGFGSLHAMFASFSAEWLELADVVAERQVAIGVMPDGQSRTIAARRDGHHIPAESITCLGAVRELTAHLATTITEVRGRVERTGEQDLVSQDVLVGVTRTLEHHLWQVRAHGG